MKKYLALLRFAVCVVFLSTISQYFLHDRSIQYSVFYGLLFGLVVTVAFWIVSDICVKRKNRLK